MRTFGERVSGGPEAGEQGPEFEMPRKVQKRREITDFTALFGGLEGIRTLDLSDANRTLSQTVLWAQMALFCLYCCIYPS